VLREVMKFQITQLGHHHLRWLVPWGWEHHMLLLNTDFLHYKGVSMQVSHLPLACLC
jgi:hypothetical protein